MTDSQGFRLEALTDFVDDALGLSFTAQHIDSMMARLASIGVSRVSWAYYADGRGGFTTPIGLNDGWTNLARSYEGLGNPLQVAATAAHRHGMELYAYYKPYETGPACCLPEGAPEAASHGLLPHLGGMLNWLDPFVVAHPELRIRHRPDASIGDLSGTPIQTMQLTKSDASPTRITAEHLQIWVSDSNYQYRPIDVNLDLLDEVVDAPKEVRDISGTLLTRRGDPVRRLTLTGPNRTGLNLTDRYVLVTTDFTGGPADFENAGTDLLTALDGEGQQIPGVFFSGAMIYLRDSIDFRNHGLVYDCGYSRSLARLDEPNDAGNRGCVAFTRGHNEYLPGVLCETEPAVQDFWLRSIAEIIEAGVDGVDMRVENHGTHTDHPEAYGYNEVILQAAQERGQIDVATIAAVRGDAYTDFLRRARALLSASGKRMRINLNMDWFRPEPTFGRRLAYPANMDFNWRQWVDQGLLDEGILRMFAQPFDAIFDDAVTAEMIERCQASQIPLTVNRYLQPTGVEEFRRVRADSRFSGYILYETASFLAYDAQGNCSVSHDVAQEIARQMATGVD
jgi:hypothetical protein